MLFVSIIWNYFEKIPIEICQYLNKYSPIKSITLLNPADHFDKFIRDVYSCNKIKQEFISNKILDLEPELCYEEKEQYYFSIKSKFLKEKIRNQFNDVYHCIENAPIIHSTDNEIETLELTKIIQEYCKICYSELIKLDDGNYTNFLQV